MYEPKRRVISAAPFVDRVVHHTLMPVTAPRLERLFSPHSFANRRGLGRLAAVESVAALCRRHAWALRLDVQQHFPSIDHAVLLPLLDRTTAEPGLRQVVRHIVPGGAAPPDEVAPAVLLPGDSPLRGGAYNNTADNCRPAIRNHNTPDNDNNDIGVRLVRLWLPHAGPGPAEMALHHGVAPEQAGPEWRAMGLGAAAGLAQPAVVAHLPPGPHPGLRLRCGPPS